MTDNRSSTLGLSTGDVFADAPEDLARQGDGTLPSWQLRFELASDPNCGFDLALAHEIILGVDGDAPEVVNLIPYGAHGLGVSRRHLKLWPTGTGMYVLDAASTNGSWLNGEAMKKNTPYRLNDGDLLTLGRFELIVRVVEESQAHIDDRRQQNDLADALTHIAKVVTAQLEPDKVLDQVLELAMTLTQARETAIWLVDDRTHELFLEAECGIEDEQIRRMRLPVSDPFVSKVIESGKPLRASRQPGGQPVKVKTGYMVEALLYVPLIHSNNALGVMAAVHRAPNKVFNARDERLLAAIADFAAIAVHNSRLYQRVQEADRLKGEMIQNISHEFRTPLTYIIGYMGLVLEQPDRLPEDLYNPLTIVAKQADKLSWLVDNFVALLTAEHTAASRTPTDLVGLLHEAVQSAALPAAEKHLTLSFGPMDTLPLVKVNHMAILQVLDNLLSNAIKFTPEGGEVTVGITLDESGSNVLVQVSDTGIGIPPDALERVFERFYQVDGTMTRRYGGVGLGLSVTKEIIEAHGGSIWVDSMPGQGSTFSFSLPVNY